MTSERREQILSRDLLSIKDVQELTGLPYSSAAQLVQRINFVSQDTLNIRGKVLTQNYIKFLGIRR